MKKLKTCDKCLRGVRVNSEGLKSWHRSNGRGKWCRGSKEKQK